MQVLQAVMEQPLPEGVDIQSWSNIHVANADHVSGTTSMHNWSAGVTFQPSQSLMRVQVQRGYTSLLASKGQRWEAAVKALQDAISTLAHFHAALATMPGAGPQQRARGWFDNLMNQVRPALDAFLRPLTGVHLQIWDGPQQRARGWFDNLMNQVTLSSCCSGTLSAFLLPQTCHSCKQVSGALGTVWWY